MNALLFALERRSMVFKLGLALSAILLIAVGVGFFSVRTQTTLLAQMRETYQFGLLGVSNAKDAKTNYAIMGRSIRQAIIAPDMVAREAALNELDQAAANLAQEITQLEPRLHHAEVKQDLVKFQQELSVYQAKMQSARAQLERGDIAAATAEVASSEFHLAGLKAAEAISALTQHKEAAASQAVSAAGGWPRRIPSVFTCSSAVGCCWVY